MEISLQNVVDKLLKKSEILEDELMQSSGFSELTPKQIECLEIIHQKNNPTLSEVAKSLSITKPSASSMVDKLESRNFVKRVRSDKDRRSAHLHLTANGNRAAMIHKKIHRKFSEILSENLTTSEKEKLIELLNKALNQRSYID